MKHIAVVALLLFSTSALMGCATKTRSYVDPTFRKATYESIQRPAQPIPVKVNVQFLRNGERLPAVDNEVRGHVERTLIASGVFTPSATATVPVVSVSANNIADLAAARKAGFKTGLTFGGSGSTVQDNYEFACTYQGPAGEKKMTYQHMLHTTIGNADAPAGMTPTTPVAGFGEIVQDVVVNFVKDLQDAGAVPRK